VSAPAVVLLCGGLGLRQRVDGDDRPKSLRPLTGRPLILHVLDLYLAAGVRRVVVCAGYRAADLLHCLQDEWGTAVSAGAPPASGDLAVTVLDNGPEAATGRRLLHARSQLPPGTFLFGYGDVLGDVDLSGLLRTHRASGAMLTLTTTTAPARFGEVVLGADGEVRSFAEKPPVTVSAGWFAAEPALFDRLDAGASLEADVLPVLAARGQLRAYRHPGWWLGLDTVKDFVDAEAAIEERGLPWRVRS
jgi:glucose-1-phosphate cytidylyltransferase